MIVLPAREDFCARGAGAIALVVRRVALASPGCVVVGARRGETFPGIAYVGVRGVLGVVWAVWRRGPKVVEVHQRPRLAVVLAWVLPQARVLLFLHNDPLGIRGLRWAWERRLVARVVHKVVCVSGYLAGRYGAGAEVLWNPLTLSELPGRAGVREKVVLFVGRVTVDKAPDVFVGACALALPRMAGWGARMIGGDRFGPGSPETGFLAEVRAAAGRAGVVFEGVRTHGEVMAAMVRAAVVVVPSRWAEPFGLTAVEAMASGAVLVTTGAGGLAEVAGEAAVYVAVDDVAGLAEVLVRLAGVAGERERLAALGLERVKLFDTPVVMARLEELRSE